MAASMQVAAKNTTLHCTPNLTDGQPRWRTEICNNLFTAFEVFFFAQFGYNIYSLLEVYVMEFPMEFSRTFWVIMIVMVLFLVAILTSSYNDDKTKGL